MISKMASKGSKRDTYRSVLRDFTRRRQARFRFLSFAPTAFGLRYGAKACASSNFV